MYIVMLSLSLVILGSSGIGVNILVLTQKNHNNKRLVE